MFIPFEELSEEARLWIYTVSRPLTEEEVRQTEAALQTFVERWETHGKPLRASAKVSQGRFILIAVEEGHQSASGCSIDASVGTLRELEAALGVNILDQGKIAFRHEDRTEVIAFPELKTAIAAGKIQSDTTIVNTQARQKREWETQSEQPAAQTWLKRYFS